MNSHFLYDFKLEKTDIYWPVNVYSTQDELCAFDNSPRNRDNQQTYQLGDNRETMDKFCRTYFRTDKCKIAVYTEMLNMR